MTHLATIGRLIRDDVRRHALPLLLFALSLSGAVLTRTVFSERSSGMSDTGVWFFGLLLAALFGRAHSIHHRAFWRTRPWPVSLVVAAKGIEVLVLLWLPMAALQLAFLDTIEPEGRRWLVWTGELFLVVGCSLLFATIIGAITRSVRALLVVGYGLAFALITGRGLVRMIMGAEGGISDVTSWAALTACAVVMWVATYTTLDRRRVAWLGLALAIGWVGLLFVPAPRPSDIVDPAISVAVADVSPPTRRPGLGREDRAWLCVDIELVDRVETGWHSLILNGSFRGETLRVDVAGRDERLGAGGQRAWDEPGPMTMIFNGVRHSLLERRGDSRGSLDLEIVIETWTERVVDRGPVRVGPIIEQSEHVAIPTSIHRITVDEDEREIAVRFRSKRLIHLADGWTIERPTLRLDQPEFVIRRNSSNYFDPSIPWADLPFEAVQRIWLEHDEVKLVAERRPSWAEGNPRHHDSYYDGSMRDLLPELRWQHVESILLDRRTVRRTLDDVSLAELACDPEKREAGKASR